MKRNKNSQTSSLVSSNTRSKKRKNISESEIETVLNNESNKSSTDENNVEFPTN